MLTNQERALLQRSVRWNGHRVVCAENDAAICERLVEKGILELYRAFDDSVCYRYTEAWMLASAEMERARPTQDAQHVYGDMLSENDARYILASRPIIASLSREVQTLRDALERARAEIVGLRELLKAH